MIAMACLDGELMPASEAKVPISDRGFLFGDAVYEVFRLYRGRPWLADAHWSRLRRSLREMEIGGVDLDRLADRMRRAIEASGVVEGTAYVHVTRGVAPRAHAFPGPDVAPTELVVVREYDDARASALRRSGATVFVEPDLRWLRCDVKSTNLLANVLAFEASRKKGGHEAILLDHENRVTEATHSSLLWVRDGRVEATAEGPEILPGTTRAEALRLAAGLGLAFAEATINPVELMRADEVFLAGTTVEIMPVTTIQGRPIGDGAPGPITRRLQAAFAESVARWLAEPAA